MTENTTSENQNSNDPSTIGEDNHSSRKTKPAPDPLRGAWKQVENIGQTLGEALQGRGNVVMVRVNDDTLRHLDMLVEAEIARSRSEAAALLINEGIKINQGLFSRIQEVTDQIVHLRSQLKQAIHPEDPVHPPENTG
ncbi:MAG: hypothetical protein AB1453_15020 [Chloroflexota bacterium]|jgi:hypothetical protein